MKISLSYGVTNTNAALWKNGGTKIQKFLYLVNSSFFFEKNWQHCPYFSIFAMKTCRIGTTGCDTKVEKGSGDPPKRRTRKSIGCPVYPISQLY